jgi:hypothetical protein
VRSPPPKKKNCLLETSSPKEGAVEEQRETNPRGTKAGRRRNRKERRDQYDVAVPFAGSIIEVTGMTPRWIRNGCMLVGYSGRGDNVTWRLKAGIVESEETGIARQRLSKEVPAATNTQARIELLDAAFSIRSLLYYIICRERKVGHYSCVEVGSNNSTVALRVVGGDEKGIQCLGG